MKKLYIFSYGLHPGQITLETLAGMRECGEVYSHCLDRKTARQFLRLAPGLKLTAGLDRSATARATLRGFERHDTVGFLTYGNPLFLNQTAAGLMRAAEEKNIKVKIFAAVSSFDALVNLFNLNKYSPRGLRLADIASMLSSPEFTPDMDTLFFVPDVLKLPAGASARKKFMAAAAKAYPASSPVYLAECASIAGREAKVVKGKIGSLARLLALVNERHTLFIPAVANKTSAHFLGTGAHSAGSSSRFAGNPAE
jgi:hypothetical protein